MQRLAPTPSRNPAWGEGETAMKRIDLRFIVLAMLLVLILPLASMATGSGPTILCGAPMTRPPAISPTCRWSGRRVPSRATWYTSPAGRSRWAATRHTTTAGRATKMSCRCTLSTWKPIASTRAKRPTLRLGREAVAHGGGMGEGCAWRERHAGQPVGRRGADLCPGEFLA